MQPERDLGRLLAGMRPVLDPEPWVFVRVPGEQVPPGVTPIATFREAEGLTLVLPPVQAANWPAVFTARRITLQVHSDLLAVGLLARVTGRLAAAGIATNAFSAVTHDHLFVPEESAQRALDLLLELEREARTGVRELIYSVTVRIDADWAAEWLQWMRTVHVPAVLKTGCFRECLIQHQEEPAESDGRIRFVFDYRAPSREAYRRYQQEFAPGLQREHSERYAGRFDASRAIRVLEPA